MLRHDITFKHCIHQSIRMIAIHFLVEQLPSVQNEWGSILDGDIAMVAVGKVLGGQVTKLG